MAQQVSEQKYFLAIEQENSTHPISSAIATIGMTAGVTMTLKHIFLAYFGTATIAITGAAYGIYQNIYGPENSIFSNVPLWEAGIDGVVLACFLPFSYIFKLSHNVSDYFALPAPDCTFEQALFTGSIIGFCYVATYELTTIGLIADNF
jgi:hypothetical protein